MKSQINTLCFFAIFLLATCISESSNANIKLKIDAVKSKISENYTENIQYFDTSISLAGLDSSRYKGKPLDKKYAKEILYAFYKNKGYYSREYIDKLKNSNNPSPNFSVVTFDTLYFLNLNGNANPDAIITYWLTPMFASGHCWQPHKAIILDKNEGYKITNEFFISEYCAIDSVVSWNDSVYIYGYDFDCGNQVILRHLRMKIR